MECKSGEYIPRAVTGESYQANRALRILDDPESTFHETTIKVGQKSGRWGIYDGRQKPTQLRRSLTFISVAQL